MPLNLLSKRCLDQSRSLFRPPPPPPPPPPPVSLMMQGVRPLPVRRPVGRLVLRPDLKFWTTEVAVSWSATRTDCRGGQSLPPPTSTKQETEI